MVRRREAGIGRLVRAGAGALALAAGAAGAGGSGENIIIIVDPLNAESMYAANYYRLARNVPESNILYFYPGADDYQAFVDFNLPALRSLIAQRGVAEQADYILLMPGSPFYIDASGYVSDQCSPVRRFSITGAYTTAFHPEQILAGVNSNFTNLYSSGFYTMRRFDSEIAWWNGDPSQEPDARRYYLCAMLGYTGERGNTLGQILDNVDRSVGADWNGPDQTFYFCQTNDQARSGPRHNTYPGIVAELASLGAGASHEMREMPRTEHDILSIFTGAHTLNIQGANMTILPGAYCDHLTSYAAMFDNGSQTKVSEWITKGATASWGTVEEPCNYAGKFTHARSMVYYYKGASMGEAVFRAVRFTPFQGLLYGDPMCRPFDLPVTVTVQDPPTGEVSGTIGLTCQGSTEKDFTFVFDFEVLVDNQLVAADFSMPLEVDTTLLADGWHDLRVLGYDSSEVESVGVWQSELVVNNLGRAASIEAGQSQGDLSTTFSFDVSALKGGGGAPVEIRLLHQGRVLDAAPGCRGRLHATGLQLGAGASGVQAEALFADGMRVRSAPTQVIVDYLDGTPSGLEPGVATSAAWIGGAAEAYVELPYMHDDRNDTPTFEIITAPAQASIVPGPAGPYRLLSPDPGATGYDVMEYRVTSGAGQSALGRVVLVYDRHPYDVNGDGRFNTADVRAIRQSPVDVNFDGVADASDIRFLADTLRCGSLQPLHAG